MTITKARGRGVIVYVVCMSPRVLFTFCLPFVDGVHIPCVSPVGSPRVPHGFPMCSSCVPHGSPWWGESGFIVICIRSCGAFDRVDMCWLYPLCGYWVLPPASRRFNVVEV